MRNLLRRFLRWLVSQNPFTGPIPEVTIERPAQTHDRHAQECADFHRMMERQRRHADEERDDVNDRLARYGVSWEDLSDFER